MDGEAIFAGLKVVEVASYIAAPAAATMLADFGAEVVKIEPLEGDPYRTLSRAPGMPVCDRDYCWTLSSRNKRSVALDLKVPEAMDVLRKLVSGADVFLTNFPLNVRERMGIAYERLAPLNPRLIYASLTGYGEHGPEANRPGYDINAWWARSGLMDMSRSEAGALPVRSLPGMGDHPTAAALYGAIVTALYRRERTGRGAHVGTSLMANGAWANGVMIQAKLMGAAFQERRPRHTPLNALGNLYLCRDGRWLILSLLHEEKLWPEFLARIGHAELGADARFATLTARRAHAPELTAALDKVFAERDAEQWHGIFEAAGLPLSVVHRLGDVPEDRQMRLNGVLVPGGGADGMTVNSPIWVAGAPKVPLQPAPAVGQDTVAVLRGHGLAPDEIETLRTAGAIGTGS
jgi:crotonobetainyl-CoA:carnitine CoA-transferase CaiB-like acyl-CoA transferase